MQTNVANRTMTVGLLLMLTSAIAGSGFRADSQSTTREAPGSSSMTPAEWSATARHSPRCETASEPADDGELVRRSWHVDALFGSIILPRRFVPSRSGVGSKNRLRFVGPDSSSISIDGPKLSGALAMGGGKLVGGRVSPCAAQLFGTRAPTQEWAIVLNTRGDTAFYATPSTLVRKGQGLQLLIQARSAERRARLLEYAESMELEKAPPP